MRNAIHIDWGFRRSYVVAQDVVGNERLVHAGILIRLQGHKSLIGESFLGLCKRGKRDKSVQTPVQTNSWGILQELTSDHSDNRVHGES